MPKYTYPGCPVFGGTPLFFLCKIWAKMGNNEEIWENGEID